MLRTRENSVFVSQFIDAGLDVIFVENIETGIKMVKKSRVDFSLSDNLSFAQKNDQALQFSRNTLLVTPITLFINPNCDVISVLDAE